MGLGVVPFLANLLALVQTWNCMEILCKIPKNLEFRQGNPRQIGIHPSSQAPSRFILQRFVSQSNGSFGLWKSDNEPENVIAEIS